MRQSFGDSIAVRVLLGECLHHVRDAEIVDPHAVDDGEFPVLGQRGRGVRSPWFAHHDLAVGRDRSHHSDIHLVDGHDVLDPASCSVITGFAIVAKHHQRVEEAR